ncbi:Hypothetical predicted protein, partial [Paramuricea clavata]
TDSNIEDVSNDKEKSIMPTSHESKCKEKETGSAENEQDTSQNNPTKERFDNHDNEKNQAIAIAGDDIKPAGDNLRDSQNEDSNLQTEDDPNKKSKSTTPTSRDDECQKQQTEIMDVDDGQFSRSVTQNEGEEDLSSNNSEGKDLNRDDGETGPAKTDNGTAFADEGLRDEQYRQSDISEEENTDSNLENKQDPSSNNSGEDLNNDHDKAQVQTASGTTFASEGSRDEQITGDGTDSNLQETSQNNYSAEYFGKDNDNDECGTNIALGDISHDEQNRESNIPQGDVDSSLKDNSTEKSKPTTPTAHGDDDKKKQADFMDINSDKRSTSDLQEENEQGPSQSNPAGNDLGDHHDEKEQVKADNDTGQSVQPNISQRDVKSDLKQSLDEDSENYSLTKQSKNNNETESKDGEGHTENDHDTTMTANDDGELDGANSSDEEMSSESDKNKNATESHNVTTTENSGFEREDKPDENEEHQIALNDGELGGPNVCNEKILFEDNVKNVQESPNMTKDVEDQDHSAISNTSKPADGPNETQVESMEVGFSSDGATDVVQDLSEEENIQDQKQNDIMTSKQEGEPDGTKVEIMEVDNERLSSESRETNVDQDALEKDSALPRFDDEEIKNVDTSVYESTGCAQFKSQILLPRNTEKEDRCVKKDGGEISKEEIKGSGAIQSFSEETAKPEGDTSKIDNSENLLATERTDERTEGSGQQNEQPIENSDNQPKSPDMWNEIDDIFTTINKDLQGNDDSESKSMNGQANNKPKDKTAMLNMASESTDDSNTNQELENPVKDNVADLETQDDDENDCKIMDGQIDKLNKISLPNTAGKGIGVNLKAQVDDENKNMTTAKDGETENKLNNIPVQDEVQERIAECKNSQPMHGKPSDKNRNSKQSRSIYDPIPHEQEFINNDKKDKEDTKIGTEATDHTFKEQETEFERKEWHNNSKQDLLENESKDATKKEFDEQIKPFESIASENDKNREIVNENRLSKNGSNVSEIIVDQNKVDSEVTQKQQKEIEQIETLPNEGQIEPENKGDKSIEVQEEIEIENTGKKKGEESTKSEEKNKATGKSEKSKVVESNDSETENNRENVVEKKKWFSVKKLKFGNSKNKKKDMTTSELTGNEDSDGKKQKGKGKSKEKKRSIEVQEEVQNPGKKTGKENKKSKNKATGKSEKSKTTNESIDAIKVVESNDGGTENNRENVVEKKKWYSRKTLKSGKSKNKKEDMPTSELTGNEDSDGKKQKGQGKSKKKNRSIEVQEEVQIEVENTGKKKGKESKKSKNKNQATGKSEKSKVVESNDSGTENNRENVVEKKKWFSSGKSRKSKNKKEDMPTSELTGNEDSDGKKQKGQGKSKKKNRSIEVQEEVQIEVENTGKKKGKESKKSKNKNQATGKSEKSKVVESNDSGTENNRENVVEKKKWFSSGKSRKSKNKKEDMPTSELTGNEDSDGKKQKGQGKSKKKNRSIEVQEEVQIEVENTGKKKGKESKKSKNKNQATGKSEKSKVVESNDSGTENNRENVVEKKKWFSSGKSRKSKNKKEDMPTSELTGNEDSDGKKQKGQGKSKKKKRSIEVQEEVQIKVENPGAKGKESKKSKKKSKGVQG